MRDDVLFWSAVSPGVEGVPRQAGGVPWPPAPLGPRDGQVEVRVGVDQWGLHGSHRSSLLPQGNSYPWITSHIFLYGYYRPLSNIILRVLNKINVYDPYRIDNNEWHSKLERNLATTVSFSPFIHRGRFLSFMDPERMCRDLDSATDMAWMCKWVRWGGHRFQRWMIQTVGQSLSRRFPKHSSHQSRVVHTLQKVKGWADCLNNGFIFICMDVTPIYIISF